MPCYNAERYVRLSLNAIISQLINKPVELIIVNDGSTDKTLEILREFQLRHQNQLVVITKDNAGPSQARNTGFKEAKGEYIWYVDADDIICEGAIDILLSYIEHLKVDIICFNYKEIDMQGNSINDIRDFHYTYNVNMGTAEAYAKNNIPSYPWNRIFRQRFLSDNGITFSGIYPEDEEYDIQTYYANGSLLFIPEVLYQYRIVSTSHSRNNIKTFILYCNGYPKIIEKLISTASHIDSKEFCTKLLFNCIRNKMVNLNRVRILNSHALPYSRKDVYVIDRQYVDRMLHYVTFKGKYGILLWSIYRLPWVLDSIIYLRYKLLKWT